MSDVFEQNANSHGVCVSILGRKSFTNIATCYDSIVIVPCTVFYCHHNTLDTKFITKFEVQVTIVNETVRWVISAHTL